MANAVRIGCEIAAVTDQHRLLCRTAEEFRSRDSVAGEVCRTSRQRFAESGAGRKMLSDSKAAPLPLGNAGSGSRPDRMKSQRVLITGATGFVGCRLAEVLVDRELEVVAMVRS